MSKAKKVLIGAACVVGAAALASGSYGIYRLVKSKKTKLPVPEHVHTEVVDAAIVPTCTEAGLTQGTHCPDCNSVLIEQTVIAAFGHDFHDGVCSMCGEILPTPQADKDGFYLVGSHNDWKWSEDSKFVRQVTTDGSLAAQYKLEAFLEADTEVRIWKGSDDWSYDHFEQEWDYAKAGDNLTITETDSYTFYLKLYRDGTHSIWVSKGIEIAVKFIELIAQFDSSYACIEVSTDYFSQFKSLSVGCFAYVGSTTLTVDPVSFDSSNIVNGGCRTITATAPANKGGYECTFDLVLTPIDNKTVRLSFENVSSNNGAGLPLFRSNELSLSYSF